MPFWSSQTLGNKGKLLIDPFREDRIEHGAYELSVGSEAYIPSDGKKSKVEPGSPVTIPPGQFGLLITREVVTVPKKAIAFISIRAGTKFRGLVNVSGFHAGRAHYESLKMQAFSLLKITKTASFFTVGCAQFLFFRRFHSAPALGFHVDPGYNDKLMFSVYNAGSKPIVLDYDQPVFLIWYADLDAEVRDPYPARTGEPRGITADDMMKIQGEVASPGELKKQLDKLKDEFDAKLQQLVTEADKKNHELETNTDKRVHAVEVKMGIIQGLLIALVIAALGAFAKTWIERSPEKQASPAPAKVEHPTDPAIPKAKE